MAHQRAAKEDPLERRMSWLEMADEELGPIDYRYDSFRSNPLGTNNEDDEPGTPNGSGWLTSSPLDYQNGNGNERRKLFETMDVQSDISRGGYEERPRRLTSSQLDYQSGQNGNGNE